MLRASIVMLTSGLAGLLFGSGIAWLLSGQLELTYRSPSPEVQAASPLAYDPGDVVAGGLFAPIPEARPDPSPPPGGETESCDGGMRLVGVAVVRGDPRRAYAAIHTAGEHWLAGPGTAVGEYTVARVEPQSAFLTRADGRECELRLFDTRVTRASITPPPPVARPTERTPPAVGNLEIEGITPEIRRALRYMRAVPRPEGGVRIYGIRRAGPFGAAGLRNGDSIVEVDGEPAGPDVAMAAYGRVLRGEPVVVTIERQRLRMERTVRLAGGN